MLNKSKSSSNVQGAIFAAALAASTGVYAEKASTIIEGNGNGVSYNAWCKENTQACEKADELRKSNIILAQGEQGTKGEMNNIPGKNDGKMSFIPNQSGISASYNDNETNFSGKIGNSNLYGTSLNVGMATKIGDNNAFALNIEGGAKVQRVLGSLGFAFENGNLIFSGEHFGIKGKYTFTSGEVEEMVKQNKAGVALNIRLGEGFLHALVLDGSITKAESKNLGIKEVVIDNATLFSIYNSYRNISGGELKQVSAGFVFKISNDTRLELKAKNESITYNNLYSQNESRESLGGEVKLTHNFGGETQGNVNIASGTAGNTYGVGIETPAGKEGRVGFEIKHRGAKDGRKADSYIGVTYKTTFGGGSNKTAPLYATKDSSNIVNEVTVRNNMFASYGILAKVDQKMERKLEVDKTGLPAGVNLVNNQGDIEVASLNVLSIATITKDAVVYANTGEFTIVGGKLRIITKNITEPVSGTNTYVVTTNNVGGGTATVTIVVAKGSVIIQSINVVESVVNIPGTIASPTLESKTNSAVNTAPGAVSGMSNVRVELYSDAGLTTLVGTQANGDFTGLTASTTYYAVTVGDDVNENTGATETKRSTALTITTEAPANVPGTIASPSLESKTNSTVNTAPGEVSGMSNVRVELYSDAGLTTLVGTQANGDFTGLTASTTYYAVTVGDDVNENTGATETKRSTALTITTEAPANVPGTIAVPTLESKTNSAVNTAPGAVSGMSNVRVELYSDAGLTTLVGTQANGDFTGLTASTTYYAVTVGDDVNENTGATETKRSTALTITTEALVAASSWQIVGDFNTFEGTGTQTELISSITALVNNYVAGSTIELETVAGGVRSSEVQIVGDKLIHISAMDIDGQNTPYTYRFKITEPSSAVTYSNDFVVTILDSF